MTQTWQAIRGGGVAIEGAIYDLATIACNQSPI